ncbi:hypothetical protein [Euzebya sp.]|uniref:hypothetical protein n=1 Tax=Euzebya sp. TaxID=1971409 RepID=UPI003517EDCC
MSVRVNLLPPAERGRAGARRANALLVLLVLVFCAALAFVFVMKQGAVDDAVADRDTAQREVNDLQAQVDALSAFQALADELATGNTTLMTAMSGEIAVARLLNDVALSLPSTASLTDLAVARDVTADVAGEVTLGENVATLQLSGYSIERYAPGVEGVLLQFDQVNGLTVTYLNTANANEIGDVGVTDFDATGLLTDEIFTGRYDEGLPEVAE